MKNIYVVGLKATKDMPPLYVRLTDIDKFNDSKLLKEILNLYGKE